MSSSLHYTNTNSNANRQQQQQQQQQSTSTTSTSTTNLKSNVNSINSNIRRTRSPAIATRTTSLLGTTRYSPSNQFISTTTTTTNVVRRSPSITKTANNLSQQQQSTYSLLQPSSNTQLRYLTVTNPKLPQSYTTTTPSSSSIRNSNINRLEDDFKAIYLSNNKNDNEYEYDNLLNRQPQQRRLSTNKQLESNESNTYFNSTSSYLIRKQQQQQASLNNDTTTTITNRSLSKQQTINVPTYDIITNNQSFNLNANGGKSLNLLGLEKKGVVGLKNLGNTVND